MFSLYKNLLKKVDQRLQELEGCDCPPGCDQCCRIAFTVFPVEAFYLRAALSRQPKVLQERVEVARRSANGETCPFLVDGGCLVYPHRPVLCRTHGYPFVRRDRGASGGYRVYVGCEVLKEESGRNPQTKTRKLSVLDLDPMNEMLVAVNHHFMKEAGLSTQQVSLRMLLSEILMLQPAAR